MNLIGLTDEKLDMPIYRIYAIDRFEALVKSNEDALVSPNKWEDPFENFFLTRTKLDDPVSGTQIPLGNLSADWYGQCWSLNEDTDAMWRIYSPNPSAGIHDMPKPWGLRLFEIIFPCGSSSPGNSIGVKAKTTIRKLFENLKATGSQAPYLQFFVGRIQYLTQSDISNLMSTLTFSDVAFGARGEKFAKLLCIKREAFRHESEVRLIFQDVKPNRGAEGIFKYSLDPNSIFEDVVLDPRISDDEAMVLKQRLESAGCTLPIHRSDLYVAPRFVISM